MKKLIRGLREAAPYLVVLSLLAAAVGAATQTNYLGTVFIADPTTPTQQLAINADGSINARNGSQSFEICFTLGTSAATKTCVLDGPGNAGSSAASVNEALARSTTFTDIYVTLSAAPGGSGVSHVFSIVVAGSTTNAPTCTINSAGNGSGETSATQCHGSGGTIAGTANQLVYIQDVITGSPAAANAFIGTAWTPTS